MERKSISFYTPLSQFFSTIGRSFYPVSRQAVGPFRHASSYAGKTVSPESSLGVAAAWACIRLLSQTVPTLPLSLYKKNSDGHRILASDHPIQKIINSSPNGYMSAYLFWQMMITSLCLWGNAYAVKKSRHNELVSLDPLRPEYVIIYRTDAGDIRYRYQNVYDGTIEQDFPASDIFHIKNFSVDGLNGLSPVALGAQSIGRTIATDEASGKIFSGGLNSSGFIKYAKALTPEQRDTVRDSISRFTAGGKDAGSVMVLENNMDFTGITMKPSDAQLLESRAANVEEICRWFGVPPVLVGHMDKASSWASSLESLNRIFLTNGLNPILVNIEQEIARSLLDMVDATKYVAAHDVSALTRADSAARASLYSTYAQNGIMSRNEIRALENLPPVDGGDDLTVQVNMTDLSQLGKQNHALGVMP